MSLQRRLLLYLLISAPLVWALALLFSVIGARQSVNELFDTELIRLARQVQVLVRYTSAGAASSISVPARAPASGGEADLSDMAIAVWDGQGHLLVADREGAELPYRPQATGFVDEQLNGQAWRMYYLQSVAGEWLVASGQKAKERHELVISLTLTQLVPWLLVLPVLLVAMAWAVRRALSPMHEIATELEQRHADDLKPLPEKTAPTEIKPLLKAMNSLFARIDNTLTRERRFTADAAHELRTPLAVLRAQWDVLRRSGGEAERIQAETRLATGLDRMDRLVTQMLALARVETQLQPGITPHWAHAVNWPAVVEQAISDCLPLADRRNVEIACEWPDPPEQALAMPGDQHLMTILLRNLLDNAVRYAPANSLVKLLFTPSSLAIHNEGTALGPDQLARLGERFYRPDGQREIGSGLGVSIVTRIAAMHGLQAVFGPGENGSGMTVVLSLIDTSVL